MEDLAGAQIKRTKLMMEADKKKEMSFSLNTRQMKYSEPVNIKPKKPVKIESMS